MEGRATVMSDINEFYSIISGANEGGNFNDN